MKCQLFVVFIFAALCMSVVHRAVAAGGVDYDIVYVRQPRFGDDTNAIWPEVFHPARLEQGADLMLLHPDGTEEVLVAGGIGSVTDPFVSFDGQWVYYAYFYDLSPGRLNSQRGMLPLDGSDIFRINVQTRQIEQLTFGEFTPNTGAGNWDESNPLNPPSEFNRLGYGILNLGPCPVPGGRIAFTSNRTGFIPPKGFTNPTLQLFVMDTDGSNITPIAPMTIGSALHPTILRDGRLTFSTYESQGLRDRRIWALWHINPDGRNWGPLVSAFRRENAFHFMSQLGNTDLVVIDYYNLNNNGFGSMYRFPIAPPDGTPAFYSSVASENPAIEQTVEQGFSYPFRMSFTPWGMHSITPFTHAGDQAAPVGQDGVTRVGKVTHPSGAPNNELLICWSPGPCNDLNRPTPLPYYDAGLYLMPGGDIATSPDDLILIKNDPNYNEAWPRAVVPYVDIHGVAEPDELPWLPNDGSLTPELPPGTPYGLVGSSSVYKRESFPGHVSGADTFDGLDAFNTSENGQSSNWAYQGSDAGKYDNSDIWAIRIVALEPNTHRSYGPNNVGGSGTHFHNHASERMRILGEIPLRKTDQGGQPILDPEGNPDTSFLVKIPADTPFTFQTIDRNGMLLNAAQTWHQVRPGEVRTDCGGCHAHSQMPLPFEQTVAADPGFPIFDLLEVTPMVTRTGSQEPELNVVQSPLVDVEFYRDIRPILQRSCIPCHTQNDPQPPGQLVLDDTSLYSLQFNGSIPGDYKRLAEDSAADWGHQPVISNGSWRQTNASRYVRKFQSRRSLLMWKLYGERLDGWSNEDHPTETTPGDAATLPPGAQPNQADLDFTGSVMPPPDGGVPLLSDDEKMLFARWIDLGCPINHGQESGNGEFGWFLDDLKPTITVSLPRPGDNPSPVNAIRIGMVDANSGIDEVTFSIKTDFVVEGRPAGQELADLVTLTGDGIYTISLSDPLPPMQNGHVFVEVADHQGNITRVDQRFSILDCEPDDCDSLTCTRDCDCYFNAVATGTVLDICDYHYCDIPMGEIDGACTSCTRRYGNTCASFGGVVQTGDILCAVVGFGDYCACPNSDLFAGQNAKGPSGAPIGTNDILATVAAFGGANPFECVMPSPSATCDDITLLTPNGCGGVTASPIAASNLAGNQLSEGNVTSAFRHSAYSVVNASITILPRQRVVGAGDLVEVDVFASGVEGLVGFEIGVAAGGGNTGKLILENVSIDIQRRDYAYYGLAGFPAVDRKLGRIGGVVMGTGVTVHADERAYLGTFVFKASEDASGAFTISPMMEFAALFSDIESPIISPMDDAVVLITEARTK